MKYIKFSLLISLMLLLTACNSVKQPLIVEVSEEELCSQVQQLISQHDDGFPDVKGNVMVTRYMDIWDAKYHLVGKSCQIWRWADGKQAYMCSVTVPNKEMAIEKYEKATKFSKQCLGDKWSSENIEREKTEAFRTIFSKPGENTSASVHRVKAEGLFDSEWTVYYFIGDRDRSL